MRWLDQWRRSSMMGPLSFQKPGTLPSSIFCFPHDVRAMTDSELVAHGDAISRRFLRLCGTTKHVRRQRTPVVAKYDKAAHLYTVHAVVEIPNARLDEVVELLAGDMDPSTAVHGFSVFLARVFGSDLLATTDVRCCADSDVASVSSIDDEVALSTLARLDRSGEDGCASVKQSVFAHQGLFSKRRSEWLLLDFAKSLGPTSFVRVFKSVDNNVSHPTHERKRRAERMIKRHKHVLFGFHVEEIANKGVVRVTFHGSHFSLQAQKETQMYLERIATSLATMPDLVFSRRLGRRLKTRRLKIPELTRECSGCGDLLTVRRSVCRLCNEYFCYDCSTLQRAETSVNVPLLELRVCHDCVRHAKEGGDMEFSTDHVELAPFINSGCHDPSWLFAISDRAMFRISEGTAEGSGTPSYC
ncbi:hypothetical protein ACHHYP_02432 [Achlya hypogyna]|uniref:FYVE zinc finger domain-containing protein n=1 Tax=Achlya hypogyna TaxID=1202772 RepID=A0A1V9Z6G8_ACHHY|nr:hypothetical protein ACHHYP_02432 [Achlya hypogyna]